MPGTTQWPDPLELGRGAFEPPIGLVLPLLAFSILLGAAIKVRLGVAGPVVSLLVIPLVATYPRLGWAAPVAAFAAAGLAAIARGQGSSALPPAVRTGAAAAGAHSAAQALVWLSPAATVAPFALSFVLLSVVFKRLAGRLGREPGAEWYPARLEAEFSLLVAPLGAIPFLAGMLLGEGALLVSTASLLALLFGVCEATNLAIARGQVTAEKERLARATTLQDELVQLLIHDIRNPLSLVRVGAQMGRQALAGQTPAATRHLGFIEQGAARIAEMADRVLELRRVEQENGDLKLERVELAGLVQAALSEHQSMAEQQHCALLADAPPGVPPVLASPLLLRQALSNLVSNALKYTGPGGRVTVWLGYDHWNATVSLGVSDTGIGMATEDISHVFARGFRGRDPRVRERPGAGIGLALTQAIVRRMGGRIDVESQVDVGTTFRLVFPVAPG